MAKKPSFVELIERSLEQMKESSPQEIPTERNLLTLLNVERRKTLPPTPATGRPSRLHDIVQYDPDTYSRFIIYLKNGAYYHVAAEAIGVNRTTLGDWLQKGRKDDEAGTDTYYSRLYKDVRKAIAECRCNAEMQVLELDPKRWLSLGPGRIFGREWTEGTPAEETEEIPSLSLEEPKKIEEKKDESIYELDAQELEKAQEALRQAGQPTEEPNVTSESETE
jgi:hypothetical protein